MGLGGGPGEWDDYEWFRLADLADGRRADVPPEGSDPLPAVVDAWMAAHPVWTHGARERVLLVDLDNLRADPARWKVRMAAMVAMARESDHAFFAGQRGAVRRAKPRLEEFASGVTSVPDGSDLADHALLDALAASGSRQAQVVVVSNDGIFADLAEDGPVTVVSPGRDALSNKLRQAAGAVVALESLDEAGAAVKRPARRRAPAPA